jgi:hypothetical protein
MRPGTGSVGGQAFWQCGNSVLAGEPCSLRIVNILPEQCLPLKHKRETIGARPGAPKLLN